ncbi:MAG: DUF86 domain-containing protein, partial [Alphaproteobacteria bacterium]|nr:DUF86 domain-containing protein [Alphaproteobacteria bacterium]
YTSKLSYAQFLEQQMTIDAVERCFERIAEAARKIGDCYDDAYQELELPYLRRFGSVLRHDYQIIEADLLWLFINNELPELLAMARQERSKFEN